MARPEPDVVDEKKPSEKKLRRRLAELTDEYRWLAPQTDGVSIARRGEIAREMKATSDTLHGMEPDVTIQVSRSVTGHPFTIGTKVFYPGSHTVKASVASQLLYMMDQNRQVEMRRLQQNGFEVDLGLIGDKAKMAEINREI